MVSLQQSVLDSRVIRFFCTAEKEIMGRRQVEAPYAGEASEPPTPPLSPGVGFCSKQELGRVQVVSSPVQDDPYESYSGMEHGVFDKDDRTSNLEK